MLISSNSSYSFRSDIDWRRFTLLALPLVVLWFATIVLSYLNLWYRLGGIEGIEKLYSLIQAGNFSEKTLGESIKPELFPFSEIGLSILGAVSWGYLLFAIIIYFVNSLSTNQKTTQFFDNPKKRYLMTWLMSGLMVVTHGFYFAWYLTWILQYSSQHIQVNKKYFSFKSKGIILFLYLFIIFVLSVYLISFVGSISSLYIQRLLLLLIISMSFALLFVLFISWFLKGIKFQDLEAHFFSHFLPFWFSISIQFFLSFISFGLYLPIAIEFIWNYIIEHLECQSSQKDGIAIGLIYQTKASQNYFYILVQLILTALTLGLYFPWATLAILRRWINSTKWHYLA